MPAVVTVTGIVVMAKAAELEPGATVTLAGTENAELALASATDSPPSGAGAVKVTAPLDPLPPTTALGLALTALSAGDPDGAGFQPS